MLVLMSIDTYSSNGLPMKNWWTANYLSEEYLTRTVKRFPSAPNGPFLVNAYKGGVTVRDAHGSTLELVVCRTNDHALISATHH